VRIFVPMLPHHYAAILASTTPSLWTWLTTDDIGKGVFIGVILLVLSLFSKGIWCLFLKVGRGLNELFQMRIFPLIHLHSELFLHSKGAELKRIIDKALKNDKNIVGLVERLLMRGVDFTDIEEMQYASLIEALKPFKLESFYATGMNEENQALIELLKRYALKTGEYAKCDFEIEVVERMRSLLPKSKRMEYLLICKRDFEAARPGLERAKEMRERVWPNDMMKQEQVNPHLRAHLAFGNWCDDAIRLETI
jgi:hypothetical protein